jgi:hypothetical protein
MSDGGLVTNQFPGLIFTNATAYSDLGGLNFTVYPPFSGHVVVTNLPGDPLTVEFATPVTDVGGYFTYYSDLPNPPGLTLMFYGAGDVLLGTVPSTYSANALQFTANPPNEYLGFNSPAGITKMVASAAFGGGYMTMDDLTFGPAAASVPEPASAMVNLILGGTGIGLTLRRRRR